MDTRVHAFSRRPLVYSTMMGYAAISTLLMATHTVGITAEHAILICIVGVSLVAPMRAFVWDWLPFLFIAVMFEDLSALDHALVGGVHVQQPIAIDQSLLGGNVSVIWLQSHLHTAGSLRWFDIALSSEYLFHFAAPLVCGAWLYIRHRRAFGVFVAGYMLMMAAGFVTELFYAETPPWLAAQQGALPEVDRIVVSMLNHLGGFGHFYATADPEPNGAMPALHVSLPALVAATVIAVKGARRWTAWLWMLYPITITFGVMYLGEHYAVDAVAGLVVGFGCFAIPQLLAARVRGRAMVDGVVELRGVAAIPVPAESQRLAS